MMMAQGDETITITQVNKENDKSSISLRRFLFLFVENLLLTGILLCISVRIIARGYVNAFHISPDGTHYLRMARQLLHGNGLFIYPDEWFATWPAGYPVIVAIMSFITRTEVYLAAMIVAIIIIWSIGISLYRRFGHTAWVYALFMFNVGFLYIFYFPLSDGVFLLGLILFSFGITDIIVTDEAKKSQYMKLVLAVMMMFLTRYVGVFALVVIGLLWCFMLFTATRSKESKYWQKFRYLTIAGSISLVMVMSYLLMNYLMAGHMTGMSRSAAYTEYGFDYFKDILVHLGEQQLLEMSHVFGVFVTIGGGVIALLLWLATITFVIYSFTRKRKLFALRDESVILPMVFMSIGIAYLIVMVVMRFTSSFNYVYHRLLFPATMLFFIGFVKLLMGNKQIHDFTSGISGFQPGKTSKGVGLLITKIMAVICFAAFILAELVIAPIRTTPFGYREMRDIVTTVYESVPDGATVLWGEDDAGFLRFLRDDVEVVSNMANIGTTVETLELLWEHLSERMVYLFIPRMNMYIEQDMAENDELYHYFRQFLTHENHYIRIK
ncbi:MAG: hypothetical protein LBC96_05220 [Lachnospiraceae bacterium]|jgi:hypothetical protein|nr:hypothetical protein [Lachnospiraceae bacterium]